MQQMEGVLGVYLIKIETGSRIDSKIYTCHAWPKQWARYASAEGT
jgi:hypothetical protein